MWGKEDRLLREGTGKVPFLEGALRKADASPLHRSPPPRHLPHVPHPSCGRESLLGAGIPRAASPSPFPGSAAPWANGEKT